MRSPSAQSRAGEPVAWRSHHEDDPEGYWSYHEFPLSTTEHEKQQPLYAHPAPPTEGEREALADELEKVELRLLHGDQHDRTDANVIGRAVHRLRALSQETKP